MKRTGIIQPGIKIECNGLFCGKCRFLSFQVDNFETSVICNLFDKVIMVTGGIEVKGKIPRSGECLTCEVLYDKEKGYVPYK